MGKIIAVVNQKGGVGKTAVSVNLSYELAKTGKKTLLVDIEPSANATQPYFADDSTDLNVISVLTKKDTDPQRCVYPARLNNDEFVKNLYIMPSDISLASVIDQITSKPHKEKILLRQLEKIREDYDYIVIDCQPTLSALNLLATYAADFLIIPVRYEKNAIKGINDLFLTINEVKEEQVYDFKILLNGLDATKKTIISKIQQAIDPLVAQGKVFKTIIRQDEEINKATAEDLPVSYFAPKSRGAQDYAQLTKELLDA